MGTIRSLAKQHNTKQYNKIIEKYKINILKQKKLQFNNDDCNILNFREEFNHKSYNSYHSFEKEIFYKLSSVCAYIITIGKLLIKTRKMNEIDIDKINTILPLILIKEKQLNFKKYIIQNNFLCYLETDYILGEHTNIQIFNLFTGYKGTIMEPSDQQGKILHAILDIVKNVYCSNEDMETNQKLYDYFLKWFSNIIKTPYNNETGITLVGKQGCGKGRFLSIFSLILDDYYYYAESILGITQKFNDFIEGKQLIAVDETESAKKEMKRNFNNLKNKITGETIDIEIKHGKKT